MFGKIKLKIFAIALCAIIMTMVIQPTHAYFSTVGSSVNVVTSGSIRMKIHKTTDQGKEYPSEGIYIMPGDVISQRVTVENDCEHPFYLRVKIVYGASSTEISAEDCINLNINEKYWELHDGWYYYTGIVEPHMTTEYVFSQVEIIGSKVDTSYIGKALSMSVNAQAVQSENNPLTNGKVYTASGWPKG